MASEDNAVVIGPTWIHSVTFEKIVPDAADATAHPLAVQVTINAENPDGETFTVALVLPVAVYNDIIVALKSNL